MLRIVRHPVDADIMECFQSMERLHLLVEQHRLLLLADLIQLLLAQLRLRIILHSIRTTNSITIPILVHGTSWLMIKGMSLVGLLGKLYRIAKMQEVSSTE